jgi:hypothetical protein
MIDIELLLATPAGQGLRRTDGFLKFLSKSVEVHMERPLSEEV